MIKNYAIMIKGWGVGEWYSNKEKAIKDIDNFSNTWNMEKSKLLVTHKEKALRLCNIWNSNKTV